MTQHFVLTINPSAQYEWERFGLRDPLTHDSPKLQDLVAAAVGNTPGDYLVAVRVEVKILEQHEKPQMVEVLNAEETIAA